jgi:hypothetical protein
MSAFDPLQTLDRGAMTASMLDEDRATITAATAILAARDLGNLPALIGNDDPELKQALAKSVYEIMEIAATVMERFPQLKEAIDRRLQQYGRAF